jgi:hypothetical protein
LLQNAPIFHADVEKQPSDKLPLESQSSSMDSLVTLATPWKRPGSTGQAQKAAPSRSRNRQSDGSGLSKVSSFKLCGCCFRFLSYFSFSQEPVVQIVAVLLSTSFVQIICSLTDLI